MPNSQYSTDQKGFTLVELVIVLMIIAIISTTVTPRLNSSNNTLVAQAHRLANDLRHVQAIAMNQGRTLILELPSATTYTVSFGGNTITDPATMQPYSVTLDKNVTLSGADTEIDSMGRPVAMGSLLAAERVFTLSGSSRTVAVTLSPVTGFVSVSP